MGRQPRWTSTEDLACCRAYIRVSEDSIVGTSQTLAALENRVQGEFKRLIPSVISGTASAVWLARSGRSVVRRYKALKASCLKFSSKRRIVTSSRLSGCGEEDAERVALMLYNGKGTMGDAYEATREKNFDVGPAFPFAEVLDWMQGNGVLFNPITGPLQLMDKEVGVEDNNVDETKSLDGEKTVTPQPSCVLDAKALRPIGSKLSKRRKLDEASNLKLARAVASIAESQKKRIEETKRRNNIALMQSEDVPEDLRKEFLRKMAEELMQKMMGTAETEPGSGEVAETEIHECEDTDDNQTT